MRVILAIMLSAVVLAGCNPDTSNDVTGSIDNCARKLYSAYNPKDLKQCIAVCVSCQRGVMTTCSTSCTLKGAY
jgi:PBP1b-binding outer membrane lipoprotein LpoB